MTPGTYLWMRCSAWPSTFAKRAGQLLLDGAPDRAADVHTKSSGTDMVTALDRASEALVVGALAKERPDDGARKGENRREGTSGVRWIIDPLDGTTNYLYGSPMSAVSIGVEVDGSVVAGVVNDPSHRELFARAGEGARCNGRPIAVSGKDDLATALIGTGFEYNAQRRGQEAQWLPTILPRVRDIRRAGAASLDLCWVACGRLDGYYETGLSPWDMAAGNLIAREAGAETSDFSGGPLSALTKPSPPTGGSASRRCATSSPRRARIPRSQTPRPVARRGRSGGPCRCRCTGRSSTR